jgi:SAM-dependent methyltransferase
VTRWEGAGAPRGDRYDERWRELEARGVDVHGEASCVEALLAGDRDASSDSPQSVLDAGCGTGRVAIELAARGFEVVGVDLDPVMLDEARRKAPDLQWELADLAALHLDRRFDAAVLAGNVMIFVVAGSEREVLARVADHLRPGGLLIAGFQLTGSLSLDDFDAAARAAGLDVVATYATWDREPYAGGDYAVVVRRLHAA